MTGFADSLVAGAWSGLGEAVATGELLPAGVRRWGYGRICGPSERCVGRFRKLRGAGGNKTAVFVVSKDKELDPGKLRRFCRERQTAYKVPRHVEFRDELPKTPVGKILRRELREQ